MGEKQIKKIYLRKFSTSQVKFRDLTYSVQYINYTIHMCHIALLGMWHNSITDLSYSSVRDAG